MGGTKVVPVQQQVQNYDLPEYVRPYYMNLLNAATATAFKPTAPFQQNASGYYSPSNFAPTPQPSDPGQPDYSGNGISPQSVRTSGSPSGMLPNRRPVYGGQGSDSSSLPAALGGIRPLYQSGTISAPPGGGTTTTPTGNSPRQVGGTTTIPSYSGPSYGGYNPTNGTYTQPTGGITTVPGGSGPISQPQTPQAPPNPWLNFNPASDPLYNRDTSGPFPDQQRNWLNSTNAWRQNQNATTEATYKQAYADWQVNEDRRRALGLPSEPPPQSPSMLGPMTMTSLLNTDWGDIESNGYGSVPYWGAQQQGIASVAPDSGPAPTTYSRRTADDSMAAGRSSTGSSGRSSARLDPAQDIPGLTWNPDLGYYTYGTRGPDTRGQAPGNRTNGGYGGTIEFTPPEPSQPPPGGPSAPPPSGGGVTPPSGGTTPPGGSTGQGGLYFQDLPLYDPSARFVGSKDIVDQRDFGVSDWVKDARSGIAGLNGIYDPNYGSHPNATRFADPDLQHAQNLLMWTGDRQGDIADALQTRASQMGSAAPYAPATITAPEIAPDEIKDFRMGAARDVGFKEANVKNWTDSGIASQYMSPYQAAVTSQEKNLAKQSFDEQLAQMKLDAAKSGAFGGSRQAVLEGMGRRELTRQLSELDSKGLQKAWEQGQQQFERDRAAGLETNRINIGAGLTAGQANQRADLETGSRNLNSALQTQDLLVRSGLQADQANQQASLEAQRMAEQSRQFGSGLDLQARDQQGNAYMQALTAFGQLPGVAQKRMDLAQLGQGMELQRLQEMERVGSLEDERKQATMDFMYNQFREQRDWPYNLANWYSGILRGVPMPVSESTTYNAYNPASQALGMGIAGLGAIAPLLKK
jgi:hypothetical protein